METLIPSSVAGLVNQAQLLSRPLAPESKKPALGGFFGCFKVFVAPPQN
jgi:hypothetical protein